MPKHKINIVVESSQSVEHLFSVLADHNQLQKVFVLPVRRIKDGAPGVNGVGSVRRLGAGPLAVEETVTSLVPNKSIEYKITKGGAPIVNHRGELVFSKVGTGSKVHWKIEFDSSLPVVGSVLRLVLSKAINLGLKRVA